MNSQQNGRLQPSRRTLVKGAAWSVPVVAVAGAAPAVAASPDPIVPSADAGTFCKHSRINEAHGVVCFNNTTDAPITLNLGNFLWNGETRQAHFSISGRRVTSATIPERTTLCLFVDARQFSSNGNAPATIFFSYNLADGTLVETSVTTTGPTDMSNCNSKPGQPGDPAPHPNPGPTGNRAVDEGPRSEDSTETGDVVDEQAEAGAPADPAGGIEATSPAETEAVVTEPAGDSVENTAPPTEGQNG